MITFALSEQIQTLKNKDCVTCSNFTEVDFKRLKQSIHLVFGELLQVRTGN